MGFDSSPKDGCFTPLIVTDGLIDSIGRTDESIEEAMLRGGGEEEEEEEEEEASSNSASIVGPLG
jgi:hypothetical protein